MIDIEVYGSDLRLQEDSLGERHVSIWNTQAYNITNVNDDGTIPSTFQENYLVPEYTYFLTQFPANYVPGQAWYSYFKTLQLTITKAG